MAFSPHLNARRVVLTTADQGLSSVSNFAVGLAVARVAGPSGFGAYALAYTVWLILVGIQRALVTEPMIIRGPLDESGSADRVSAGLATTVLIGLLATGIAATAGGIVYAIGARTLALGLLGIAPWLLFLLVQDFWRWTGLMQGAPGKALVNDLVFNLGQATVYGAIVLVGIRSPAGALAAWGAGALLGSLLGFRQFSVSLPISGVRRHFCDTWSTGRWLLGENLTQWLSSQAYVIAIGVMLGPLGLGAFRAAQTLNGPLGVLLQIGGSIGLPEASRGYKANGLRGLHRVCRLVTMIGLLSAAAFGAVVFIGSDDLMGRAFGSQYRQFGGIAVLIAVANIIGSLGLGTLLSVKVRGLTRYLFGIRVLCGALSIMSVVVLAPRLGTSAAGWAVVVTIVANVLGLLYVARRTSGMTADEHASVGWPEATAGAPDTVV